MKELVKRELLVPEGVKKVLLHTCCAPCSVAIIDSMISNAIEPVVFFYNPNIYPQSEYDKRKAEIARYAAELGLEFIDADNSYADWLKETEYLKDEPERGERCNLCFRIRFEETARYAHEYGLKVFASTLGSSRWKDLTQINLAGKLASEAYDDLTFWEENWRKGGLANKQSEIIKQYDFYRQQYCGCEFSQRKR